MLAPIDFVDAIETIEKFLNSVVLAIREDDSFSGTWDSVIKAWKPRAVPYKDCGSDYDEGWLDEICTENRNDEE